VLSFKLNEQLGNRNAISYLNQIKLNCTQNDPLKTLQKWQRFYAEFLASTKKLVFLNHFLLSSLYFVRIVLFCILCVFFLWDDAIFVSNQLDPLHRKFKKKLSQFTDFYCSRAGIHKHAPVLDVGCLGVLRAALVRDQRQHQQHHLDDQLPQGGVDAARAGLRASRARQRRVPLQHGHLSQRQQLRLRGTNFRRFLAPQKIQFDFFRASWRYCRTR
jgi:uncharacterized SAM-binding protein YcdF (DUF218 family)